MASSGTLPSPSVDLAGSVGIQVDARFKPNPNREDVLIMGRTRIKSTATIEAGDLTLRTIKSAVLSPYDSQPLARPGGPPVVYGSITVSGSFMNNIRMRSFRGSIVPHTGTQHIGTAAGGTMQVSFLMLGA